MRPGLVKRRSREYLVDPAEKPDIRLRIEVNQGEDIGPVELASSGAPRVPIVPFLSITDKDVQGMLFMVPGGEVSLVSFGVRNRQKRRQEDWPTDQCP